MVNPLKRDAITKQLNPSKLALQHTRNASAKGSLQGLKGLGINGGGAGDIAAVEGFAHNYDLEGPHAGSLGLAGGPQPRRIRFGNFLKSLVGLRPSVTQRNGNGGETGSQTNGVGESESGGNVVPIPSSPEITITRTPSEQNMVVMRDPNGRQDYNVVYSSREKLANGERVIQSGGSTSSLNVMQQKLWNIMRREGSAISLHQEKSQSIVHYTGLRKCETVIALTRQTSTPCSPTMVGSNGGAQMQAAQQRLSHTGSGIFSASGVEQIRPLNRLRNSVSSMNNTCSRCSSLLSLAASSSRYSLNSATANPHPMHQHQHHHPHSQQHHQYQMTSHFSQYQRNPSNVSSSNLSNMYSHSRESSLEAGLQFAVKRNSRTSTSSITNTSSAAVGSQRNSSSTAASSSRTPSLTSPTITTATATNTTTTASTVKLTPPPTENLLTPPAPSFGPSTTTPTTEKTLSAPLTVTSHFKILTMKMETQQSNDHGLSQGVEDASRAAGGDVIDGIASKRSSTELGQASSNVSPTTATANTLLAALQQGVGGVTTASASMPAEILKCNADATNTTTTTSSRPFELFTCKLCLIDVEDASNSTVLHQCGCQFCTEVSSIDCIFFLPPPGKLSYSSAIHVKGLLLWVSYLASKLYIC